MKSIHFTTCILILTVAASYVCSQSTCTQPSNWISHNFTVRVDEARNVIYAKAIEKKNYKLETYGETYDVTFELECDVKVERGIIVSEVFTVQNMGARPDNCPSRDVETSQYYILFLLRGDNGNFMLEEVNQQDGAVLASWDNLKLISGTIQKCLTDVCNPASVDGWAPMTEMERADLAEIIVHVKVTETHETAGGYYIGNTQLICPMKVPDDLDLGTGFNISQLGEAEGTMGQCADDHVSKDHEFIIFLERHFPFFPPLIGTLSPELLDQYLLGVDEVNFQQGIWNVTDEVKEIFKDYLADCPGGGNSASSVQFMFNAIIFNCAIVKMMVTYFL